MQLITLKEKKEEVKNLLNMDADFIVLDVDRTIINTTSWYQACMCPNLLIREEFTKDFKKINDLTFKNPTEDKLKVFRKETFNLIEKTISKKFLRRIRNIPNIRGYFKLGDNTNIWRFYVAGLYTANNLVKIYDDAIDYIKYAFKYYGNNLKVIFLTSGYEPFIRGVVDGIIAKTNLNKINYSVIGSQICFEKSKIKEIFHMSQFEKEKIVKMIIKNGGKVRFLADDSKDNVALFNIVKNNGGVALNIEHRKNSTKNPTWKSYMETITKDYIKFAVKNDDSTAGLNKENIVMPEFLERLAVNTNEIGIASMSRDNFKNALSSLKEKIKNEKIKEEFESNVLKLIFEKSNTIYFRGKLFYMWLPQYLFIDNRSINDRLKDLFKTSANLLKIVYNEGIIDEELTYYQKVIVYSFIDHLQEAILYILNLIEQNSLANNNIYNTEHDKIIELAQNVSDMLYAHFYVDGIEKQILKNILDDLETLEIVKSLPRYTDVYKRMRELDDNVTIFKFVKSIADKMYQNGKKLDYIISFPYGGITLGFAMRSYMKFGLKQKEEPRLLNSHFSSKQKLREKRTEKDKDFSIFKFIPKKYNCYVDEIKKGNATILLLDNNVTTFKTLDLCKNFLTQIGNEVFAAVAAVNYDNIAEFLLNKESENLVPNWRKVLDFCPTDEYVTAFNTWNTSRKSKILQDVFYIKELAQNIQLEKIKNMNKDYIFKVCRVQNVQDLNAIVKNGANMIGIHAVYPDRIKYLKNEIKYEPLETNLDIDENLPIGMLELEGIRDIQNYIPDYIKQAVLFERPLSIDNMIKSCDMYNLPKEKIYIQLQHRTNREYIQTIKSNLSKKVIATIGLFQKDFEEYFWKIHDILDPDTDYILIDMSKHQPDLISFSESYKDSIDKVAVLNHLAPIMQNNSVPVIIADDTTVYQMGCYLKEISKYNIKIKGIDMQNSVELPSNEQKYQYVKCNDKTYQVKIRKSGTELAKWDEFFNKNNYKLEVKL